MDNITTIQDAQALKRMGLPLNMLVKRHEFSKAYSKRWFALMKAHDDFCGALAGYLELESPSNWRKLRRRLNEIVRVGMQCDAAIEKFEDPIEQALMAEFVAYRARPFVEYWDGALDAIEEGATLTINPADWPKWTD